MLPVQGALSVSRLQSLGLKFLSLGLKFLSLGLKFLSLGLNFLSLGLKFLSLGLKFLSLGLKFLSLGLKIQSLGLKFQSLGLKIQSLRPWFEPMKYAVRASGATARSAEMPHSKAGTCAPNELFFLLLHEKATPHYTHDPR